MAKVFAVRLEDVLKNKSDYEEKRRNLSNEEYQYLYTGNWANVEDLKKLSGEIKKKEDQVSSLQKVVEEWKTWNAIEPTPIYWGQSDYISYVDSVKENATKKDTITFVDKNAYITYEFLRSLFLSYYDGKTESFTVGKSEVVEAGYFFTSIKDLQKVVKFQNMDFLNKCTKCEDENYSCIITVHDDMEFEVMRTCSCGNTLKFFIPAKEISYYNYAENEPELWIKDELAERLSSGEVIVKFTDILKEKMGMVSFIFADRNAVIA